MKSYIIIFTLFHLSYSLKAQFFEKSFQNNISEQSFDVIPNDSNGWIIAGNRYNQENTNSWVSLFQEIYNLDINGNIIWSLPRPGNLKKTSLDLEPVNNGFVSVGSLTDYKGRELLKRGGFFTKYDYNGNEIWNYQNSSFNIIDSAIIQVIHLNNNDILGLSTHGELIRLDENGSFINKSKINNTLSSSFVSLIKGLNMEIIIAAKDSIYRFDSNINLLQKVSFNTIIKDLTFFQNNYYSIHNQSITQLDTQFQLINTNDFSNDFSLINKVKFHGNQIIIAGKDGNNQSILNYYNLNFQLQNTVNLDNPALKVNQITVNNNDIIAIIGSENIQESEPENPLSDTASASVFIKTYDINGQTNEANIDVELLEVKYDNISFYNNPCSSSNITTEKGMIIHNVELVIKNNGNTVIDSLDVLRRKIGLCSYAHSEFTYHQRFKNLALAPNTSITISLGNDDIHHVNINQAEETFCFWLTSPNGAIDNNIWNNKICETQLITSTNHLTNDNIFNIFPNPVFNQLNIEFEKNISVKQITIINQVGQIITNQIIHNNIAFFQVNTNQLESGLYILQVETENDLFIEKFIKQ